MNINYLYARINLEKMLGEKDMKRLQTGDQSLVKQINKSIVFHTVKNKGPISRAQISKETGLNKATVSTMVSELIKESFIQEIGAGKSSGGRKPVLLYFHQNAGYAIGIDLGVNYILGVLTDLSGNVIYEMTEKLKETTFKYVTNKIFTMIESLIQNAPESPYGIVGIGIGVPGQVDNEQRIQLAPNLKWYNVDLKQVIEERYSIPVRIENEANAGAHAEHLYGAGKNIANQIYISIGMGIGTGIIVHNQLYKGTLGFSGEMGHFTIEANGRKCSCGNRGCWELYASESALLLAAEQNQILNANQEADLDILLEEARNSNPQVLQLLNTLGENIGVGIVNIINTFNPEAIIIGNRITRFKNWLTNPIERIIDERLANYFKESTEIRFSALNYRSTALGATSIAIEHFLSEIGLAGHSAQF